MHVIVRRILVCRYYWLILAYHGYISISVYVIRYALILNCIYGWKNAWTKDLKWCNYAVCPVEGGPLFNNQ